MDNIALCPLITSRFLHSAIEAAAPAAAAAAAASAAAAAASAAAAAASSANTAADAVSCFYFLSFLSRCMLNTTLMHDI